MKTYILSFADSLKHVPANPERTAIRSLDWDVKYQVWPSRAAMLKTIEMQGKRAPHRSDWRACKIPAKPEPVKTAGQLAYETDCDRAPRYHDGAARRSWESLPDYARQSWERNPTPRNYPAR